VRCPTEDEVKGGGSGSRESTVAPSHEDSEFRGHHDAQAQQLVVLAAAVPLGRGSNNRGDDTQDGDAEQHEMGKGSFLSTGLWGDGVHHVLNFKMR
jgi:hypothetical protein